MPREAGRARAGVALIATRYELVRELRVDAESVFWEAFDAALDRSVVVQLLRPDLAHDPAATERFTQYTRAVARRPARVGERILDGGTDPESGQLFMVREWPARPPGGQRRLIGLLDRRLSTALLDLDMMLKCGGKERDIESWQAVLTRAGFRLVNDPPIGARAVLDCRLA